MKNLKDLTDPKKGHQLVLAVLFIVYILFPISTPDVLSSAVDSMVGRIVVILIALSTFVHSSPVVGILGLVVAFILIKRSEGSDVSYALKNYIPTEKTKSNDLNIFNQFPVTLEEEVVQKMAPIVTSPPPENSNFKPVLDPLYSAAPIDYKGVV